MLERPLELPVTRLGSVRTRDDDKLEGKTRTSSRFSTAQDRPQPLFEASAHPVPRDSFTDLFGNDDTDAHTVRSDRTPAQAEQLRVPSFTPAQTLKGAVTL